MEQDESLTSAQRVFLQPSALEEEADFQATLAQLACTGLQWGGGLGLLGLLILVPVNVFLLGRPVAFWYPSPVTPEVFVLWDEAVGTLLCSAAIWVGATQCRLSVARTAGSVIAGLLVAVSLVHDAVRGVLVIEYVILVYLLTVAAIPYRPWQALLLGVVITSLLAGIGLSGVLGVAGDGAELVGAGHLVRMGFVTVVFTGVSALLYVIRYRQHRARQEAEALHEQVARLERAKSRFFADLSHEFRTPLTLILGPLQDALEGRLGTVPDALRDRLEGVEHQARQMKRLVDQLFDLARLDEGDVALAMQEHDLTALTQEVVPPLRQWAEENGLTFQMDVAPDRLDVWMDADRIRQLLTTLLSSAIRYTPEDGTVRLRVRRTDGSAEIAVRDTGPGLPDALQKRVFGDADSYVPVGGEEEGEPAASLNAEQQIGLGIGLAHADALARRHGGRIDVESEPGFGAEWTVRLPLGREHVADEDVADPEAAVPRVDGAEPTGVPTSASTDTTLEPTDDAPSDAPAVLVVDDEAEMRTYLADLLGRNYQVVTATDGEAALDRLRDRPIDLVIGDVAMPGMDGVALCRAIRDDEQLRHLPVILLTARPEDRAQRANLEAGADAYVSKPFDPAELTARVENLIEIRRIVQDRIRLPDWMDPDEATVSSEEAEFVEALNEVMDTHIDNSNFGVDWLADEMDLSARHLRRRIKDTTGLSASGFIRTRRLQHAAALLQEGADTISDVADAVGYRDPSYFSRLFRETFGCSPTEYAEQESEPPDEPDIGP